MIDVVDKVDAWRVLDAKCCPASWHGWNNMSSQSLLRMVGSGQSATLVHFAARSSFRGMTRPHLLKLCSALEVEGAKPSTVAKVVNRILMHVFPDSSEDFLEACLAERGI